MRGSIRRLPSGRYEARWRDETGRRRGRTFQSRKSAEAHLRDVITKLERGESTIDQQMTVADFAPIWSAATRNAVRPRSWDAYESRLRVNVLPHLGGVPLARLDVAKAQRWVNTLSDEGLSPGTVQLAYAVLSLLVRMAHRHGYPRRIERGDVLLPRASRSTRIPDSVIPTAHVVEALSEAIDPRCSALILMAGFMGLRQGELLALHPSDVDWDQRRVYVHRSMDHRRATRVSYTKGRRVGYVTMPTRVTVALQQHVGEYPHGEYVFHRSGYVMQAKWLHRFAWTPAKQTLGLDASVTFHMLRHTAASLMIRAGWSLKRVQAELRHESSTRTFDLYGHLFADEIEAGRERLDVVLMEALRDAKAVKV